MILFAGLGNPGEEHRRSRHNIGFMAADALMRHHGFAAPRDRGRSRLGGEIAEGRIGGSKAFILKPMGYMNLSGQSLGEAARYFDIAPEDIIVFYDEIDLPLGKMRLRKGGGAGGHNGIRSCIAHIGADFRRVRLGIGHPGDKALVSHHVLGNFSKKEMTDIITPWLEHIASEAELLTRGEDSLFANRIHLAMEKIIEKTPAKKP